ncbi:MAG TPA: 23S rRNA (guanosine(2251)-2'-O)-methyltransferase RlmB [Clostridiales bacterium]|nr:23S rRNA (guanosine(2251)-2'-O)-methyltransferase RlmB [Clostridiales bacterium]
MGRFEQIEGRHPVLEAIRAGRRIHRLFIVSGARGSAAEVADMARAAGIPVTYVPRARLDAMSGGRVNQGVVALAEPMAYRDLGDLLSLAEQRREAALLVALDGVEDPRNLGAVIRTAAAAGVHGLVLPTRRAVGLTPAAVKAAAGAADRLPVARVVNLARAMDELREKGLWTIGADAAADMLYTEVDFTLPAVIVLGGEHRGLRRLVREKCDFLVRIPMRGPAESLNVSVAAAVLIFEAVRQRSAGARDDGPPQEARG